MVGIVFKIVLALLLIIPTCMGIIIFLRKAIFSLKDEARSLKR